MPVSLALLAVFVGLAAFIVPELASPKWQRTLGAEEADRLRSLQRRIGLVGAAVLTALAVLSWAAGA